MADDSLYTKVVARRMIEMTQHINTDYKTHVADTGVTCYTCHRGMPVPANVWFAPEPQKHATRMVGSKAARTRPAESVALHRCRTIPSRPICSKAQTIAVNATTALPNERVGSIAATEQTYALMMHMSDGLGVNCTYCHNSRAFSSWSTSTPQRVTAWHGIRMARDLNNTYMEPLTQTFPVSRLGALGDVAKVNCATCHQGAYKPLYGASMLKDYPALSAVGAHAAIPVSGRSRSRRSAAGRAGSRGCSRSTEVLIERSRCPSGSWT
jgi:photosynthetic reaction center cytochrome c subunit